MKWVCERALAVRSGNLQVQAQLWEKVAEEFDPMRGDHADDDEDKRVREVRPLVSFLLKTSPGCVRYDFG